MKVAERLALKFRFNVWAKLKTNIYPSYNLSHSQFGEDMVLRALIDDVDKKGFYVDIGAHHPVFLSNTYHFYSKGWRGINIDATPGSMEAFRILRPEDINLEACLSTDNSQVTFYMFENAPLNTFDPEMAKQAIDKGASLIDKKVMKTTTLTECLDSHLPKGTEIDLMSIDIEGGDELILMSNDWRRYQPKIIVFEKHVSTIQEVEQLPIMQHLAEYEYKLVAKCGPSFILKR